MQYAVVAFANPCLNTALNCYQKPRLHLCSSILSGAIVDLKVLGLLYTCSSEVGVLGLDW